MENIIRTALLVFIHRLMEKVFIFSQLYVSITFLTIEAYLTYMLLQPETNSQFWAIFQSRSSMSFYYDKNNQKYTQDRNFL